MTVHCEIFGHLRNFVHKPKHNKTFCKYYNIVFFITFWRSNLPVALKSFNVCLLSLPIPKYVSNASSGAAQENISKCLRIRFLKKKKICKSFLIYTNISATKLSVVACYFTTIDNVWYLSWHTNHQCALLPDVPTRCIDINLANTYLSNPACMRNVTSPKAAGALCSMMARNTISSTSAWDVVAAAPSAMPSAITMFV